MWQLLYTSSLEVNHHLKNGGSLWTMTNICIIYLKEKVLRKPTHERWCLDCQGQGLSTLYIYTKMFQTQIIHIWVVFFFCFICTPIPGEMLQFDEHIFSDGLKPPTRYGVFTIIYLHEWFIFTVNVGTYASPMDAMGYGFWAQVAGNLLRFFFTEPRYEAYGTYHPWDDCIWKPTINRWFYGNGGTPPEI